mmetsp:Transcript_15611/g.23116  ORF Transcript_15611/g.23116 Transcript_15611/m.23116 type:complete len:84 (+) Transcript_15611:1362-1613(+)
MERSGCIKLYKLDTAEYMYKIVSREARVEREHSDLNVVAMLIVYNFFLLLVSDIETGCSFLYIWYFSLNKTQLSLWSSSSLPL